MYSLKYKSIQFAKMDADSLINHSRGLVIKISIITGWPIPDDQTTRNILYDQFAKKILEDYSTLNVEEVEYAIRSYGTKIKDWGKNINLSMIDEALTPYLIERKELSELEERCAPVKQIEHKPEPLNDTEMVDAARGVYKMTKKTGLIPVLVYDILIRTEEIVLSTDEKKEIFAAVEKKLEGEAAQEGLNAVKEFRDMKKNKRRDYATLVANECKRRVVALHFDKMEKIDEF